jgi:hypothetical protein
MLDNNPSLLYYAFINIMRPGTPENKSATNKERKKMKHKLTLAVILILVVGFLAASCDKDNKKNLLSSLSYKGHESDVDSNAFVTVYPSTLGTRLDDCQLCHRGGEISYQSGKQSTFNPCAYCHLIPYPDNSVVSGAPASYEDTLNPYGLDYKKAGRTMGALRKIAGLDSDNDSHTNKVEIDDLRYPGDPESKPGQPIAPIITLDLENITPMTVHEQFMLMNSHKQEFDFYATYKGVKVKDLLEAAGVDLSNATSLTFIAPDGYTKDIELDNVNNQFPDGLYFANLDAAGFADPEQGFVQYPPSDQMPAGLVDNGAIPGSQWLMIAYGRDGNDLDNGYLDAVSGRLRGEGPYRLIVPQNVPGAPDRGSKYSPSGYTDGHDYDDSKDHNAGMCIRALTAIRINPMPMGYEEFDWKNGGWALVERKQIIIYGCGVDGE